MTASVSASAEVIPFPDLEEKAVSWPERAGALAVTDAATFETAGGLLRDIKTLRKEIAESCDPVVKAAHEAHKKAVKQKKDLEAPLLKAEKIIKDRMGEYAEAEERRRREEEARLAAEARAQEEEARLREAEQLEKAGEHEAAEEVISAPSVAPPPVVPRAVPKTAGVSTRENWSAQVTSLEALVKAVAEGKASIGLVQANETALNGMARSLKGSMQVPGVKAICKRGVAATGR
jgi:colicin import membrane protein